MADQNPWRLLPAKIRQDLAIPLLERTRFHWDQSSFLSWLSQWYAGKRVDPNSVYPEWRFNCGDGLKRPDERNMLLCLYAKLKREALWDHIGGIHWFSLHAEMLFVPAKGESALRQALKARGYEDVVFASNSKTKWGVRSTRPGAELHFRGPETSTSNVYVNVHIDLHNPGRSVLLGINHHRQDLTLRGATHNLGTVRAALKNQGIAVFDVP
jgi:hypothetical protein